MKIIKSINKITKAKKALVCALSAAFAISAAAGVASLAGGGIADAMLTTNLTPTISGGIWNTDDQQFNAQPLKDLVKQLTGKPNGTLAELETYLSASDNGVITATQIAANNGGKDIILHSGNSGIQKFTPTYVSRTESGDIIVTLWYAYSQLTEPYSAGWNSTNKNFTYPADMYSSSYIRSFINGTPYAQAAGADPYSTALNITDESMVSINYTGAWESNYKDFLSDGLSQFMVQPKFVPWQVNGLSEVQLGFANWKYNAANTQLSTENLNFQANQDYSDKGGTGVYYDSWGNDYLWLPSLAEVGYVQGNTSFVGLWNTTEAQRVNKDGAKTSTTNASGQTVVGGYWMRSASTSIVGYSAHMIYNNGEGSNLATHNRLAVRPAFHLNLTKALASIGDGVDNSDLQEEWCKTVERSLTTRSQQTFTLKRNWIADAVADETVSTSFGTGTGFNNGRLYVPAGANIVIDLNGNTLDRNLGKSVYYGNVIVVEKGGTLTVEDSSSTKLGKISGGFNLTNEGGGLYSEGNLIINGGIICNNRSDGGGGGGVMSWGKLTINGGTICNNYGGFKTVSGIGGGVAAKYDFEMNGGVISDNTTQGGGAGLYISSNSQAFINGGEIIRNNTFSGGGGGGLNTSTNVTINIYNVKISGNYSLGIGGGFYFSSGAVLNLYGGEISDNHASANGGGFYANNGAAFYFYDGEIKNNESTRGGGFYATGSTIHMYGGVIDGNLASLYGGASYIINQSQFFLHNGTISNNKTGSQNTEVVNGGAVLLSTGSGKSVFTMNGGRIVGNVTEGTGSAVQSNSSTEFVMNGGIITGNDAQSGAAVNNDTGNAFKFNGGQIIGNINSKRNATNGPTSNVGLSEGSKITIGKRLPDNAKIGVHFVGGTTGAITNGYTTQGNAAADYNKYFSADVKTQNVSVVSGEINLIATAAAAKTNVQWTLASNGGTPVNRPTDEIYFSREYNPDAYYTVNSVGGVELSSIFNEYGLAVSNPVSQVGVYRFTVKNAQNYNNPVYTLEITPRNFNDGKLAVEFVEKNLVYDGNAHTPEVKVTYNGVVLTKGVDYTVAYSDNVNAGQATVTVTGKGNYFNSKVAHFDIGKRNLQLRWGDAAVDYDGNVKGINLYAEGGLSGDNVSVGVVYEDRNGGALNGRLVSPVNAGVYRAYAVIKDTNYQFANSAAVYREFTINPKKVEAVWDTNSLTYTGGELAPTAYYIDLDGNQIPLVIAISGVNGTALVGGKSVNAGEYLATATAADGNYAPTFDTATLGFEITPARLNVNKTTGDLTYNGNAQGLTFTVSTTVTTGTIPTADDLEVTYYPVGENNVLGAALAGEPVTAGRYCAAVESNDGNFTTNEVRFYFDVEKAEMTVTESGTAGALSDITLTYTGAGVNLEFAATGVNAETLDITVTYSANGGASYAAEVPVNAGAYTVKITENGGNYNDVTVNLTIDKKTVTVEWQQDDYCAVNGTTFVWPFNGNTHEPKFVTDDESVEVVLTGARNSGSYTVTAQFANAEYSKNYKLANATANCRVENSVITDIAWFPYGAQNPLGDGENYEIEEIYVYGSNGPRLSAYGVVTVAGAAKSSYIALDVEYVLENGNLVNQSGMWTQGVYTAKANGDKYGAQCELPAGVTASIDFTVIGQKHDTETVVGIVWVVETDAGYVTADGVRFIYNGRPQSPVALMPKDLGGTVDLGDPTTYTVLETGGRYTNAGNYVAFIRPGNYNIDPADASYAYTIEPKEIEVGWAGDTLSNGGFEWTFDGVEHGPVATAKNVTGVTGEILITVEKEVNAGTYTAVAKVNKNFTIIESDDSSATQEYTITKRVINPLMVNWSAEDADDRDGYYVWTQDGKPHAPTATLTVDGITLTLKVTGATAEAGTHYAFATLDENDFANANYSLTGASKRFDIVRNTITQVLWRDNEFTYDGAEHKPTAYYINDAGEEVELEVFGARTDAGKYVAYVSGDAHVLSGATCDFTINPKKIAVEWTNGSFTYNGEMQKPTAKAVDVRDETTSITLQEGVDYTVTGYRNAGSHVALITFINVNYTYESGSETCAFEIAQKKVHVYWQGVDGAMVWQYDGEEHAPTVQAEQRDLVAGESITVTVLGAESRVGEYTAYAITDENNYYLVNSNEGAAAQSYRIKPYAITLEWHGNEDKDGAFEWDYKGTESFAPTATYTNWEKNDDGEYIVHELTVENGGIMGAQTDASLQAYVATALLPENCEFSGGNTKEFKINKWTIQQVDWSADEDAEEILGEDGVTVVGYRWTFDGNMHGPSARVHATGAALVVTGEARGAGKYVAVAKLSNPENYAFSDDTEAQEIEFEIVPKTVDIEWFGVGDVSESDVNASFDWAYTGSPICPVPKFENVDGEYVVVPVSGAAVNASASEYYANAIDVFNDYDFNPSSTMKAFTIHKKDIVVSWTGEVTPVDDVYTYEFNGTAQQPFATADVDGVMFKYSVTNASGDSVNTVISVGTYTITATPMDSNYAASGTMSVTVKIEPKPVEVVWGEKTLTYTGSNVVPKAWYIDASGLAVELVVTVDGDHSAAGTYSATPSLASGTTDYVLKDATATQYTIVKYTVDKVEWDFEKEEWKVITSVTPDPDEGDDTPVTGV